MSKERNPNKVYRSDFSNPEWYILASINPGQMKKGLPDGNHPFRDRIIRIWTEDCYRYTSSSIRSIKLKRLLRQEVRVDSYEEYLNNRTEGEILSSDETLAAAKIDYYKSNRHRFYPDLNLN